MHAWESIDMRLTISPTVELCLALLFKRSDLRYTAAMVAERNCMPFTMQTWKYWEHHEQQEEKGKDTDLVKEDALEASCNKQRDSIRIAFPRRRVWITSEANQVAKENGTAEVCLNEKKM
jgi:hypothetical protein